MTAFIVVGVAVVFGLDLGANFGPISVLGAIVIIFLFGTGLSSVFVAVALRSTRMETQSAFINFVTTPLTFASGTFSPIGVRPGWLQTVANANPTSYSVDAMRRLMIDGGGLGGLAADFEFVGTFALAMTVLSIVLSWRFLND